MRLHRSLALRFAVLLLAPTMALANTAPGTTREEVRKELAQFFAHLGDKQSAFSDISKSPQTLKEIDERINSMSDQEIADFQKMMTEVPDWQNAPQAITKMLPAGALKKIQSTSAEFSAQVPQTEKMRNDVGTLAAVLKMLPDEKLKELGIERTQVGSLEAAVAQLSPVQAGVLDQKLANNKAWQSSAQAALAGLPPALQKGAAALAQHGELTKDDLKELEKFRADVITLFDRVNGLPQATKEQLKVKDLSAEVAQIDRVSPDILFMLRDQITPEEMKKLSDSVNLMERIANLSDNDKKTLEGFRGDLEGVFDKGDHASDNQQKIASLSDGELLMLKDGMPDFDNWKQTTGAYVAAFSDPGLPQRLGALQRQNPDPALAASLEAFRAQTLAAIDAAGPSLDPKLAASAHTAVAGAPLTKLEFLRTVTTSSPNMSPQTLARVANDISLNCVIGLGQICFGSLGCVGLGSIDLSFICNPFQNAINDVLDNVIPAIQNAFSSALTTVENTLQAGINAVTNTVDTLVNGIINTVNNIWSFIQNIPNLVWNALKTAINAFLDIPLGGGLTIRTLISGGISQVVPAVQQALNLGESFWNSLNDSLPLLPCPPAGFSTPFGTVGTSEAVTKYNRYHFFIEKIVGMIPSDAISLEVKIPAEILYSAWDYLGVCLQDAADDSKKALEDSRFGTLSTGLTTITNNEGSLSNQILTEFAALSNQTNTNDVNLTNLIDDKATEIENLIKQRGDNAQKLELQLQIELNLAAGQGNALAMFELPQADGGYLETARDIVNSEINNMLAAGQSIGQAQKFFSDGLSSMSSGKFKTAYNSFQKAYQELTKNN